MDIFFTVLSVIVFAFLLYTFSVMGRRKHPGLPLLRGWSYAHRGLHDDHLPENSMAAFRAALKKGYGIELDLHLLKDGNLAVIHDHSLLRTAGVDIKIEDLTTEDLSKYHLESTSETIPTFAQVLELFDGKAPMIVELKAIGGNHAALTDKAVSMLKGYRGIYCIESFDPRCIRHLKKCHPHIIRGQLTENFLPAKGKLPLLIRCMMTWQFGNFLLQPDFVAYKFADRKNLGNFLVRKFWGVQGVTWTLKTPQEYDTAVKEGWLPIFEGFEP